MHEAFFKEKKRKKYAKISRKFAMNYNWDDVVMTKWIPFIETIQEDCRPKSMEERKIA